MTVRVVKKNRQITPELVIQNTIGMRDPYGNPFQVVRLEWTPHKICDYNQGTAGFEEAILRHNQNGVRGISIEYVLGKAVWISDPVREVPIATIPWTPHNKRVLVGNYYEGMWRILDARIDAEIKIEADKADAELQKIPMKIESERLKSDGRGGFTVEINSEDCTMLDIVKRRRQGNFMSKSGGRITRWYRQGEADVISQMEAALVIERKQVEALKEQVEKEKAEFEEKVVDAISLGYTTMNYTFEYLDGLNYGKLRQLAKSEFGIVNINKKEEIIQIIMEKQGAKPKESIEPVTAITGV